MNRKLSTVGRVCAATVIGLATVFACQMQASSDALTDRQAEAAENQRIARIIDEAHYKDWTGADNTRAALMHPNQPIPDTDFQWAIQKLDLKKADKNSRVAIATFTISALIEAKLSSSQTASLVNAALPLLKMDDSSGDIEQYACKVFVKHPDSKAIPQLHVLLNSPHIWVRRDSARALVASGENVPIPPRPKTW